MQRTFFLLTIYTSLALTCTAQTANNRDYRLQSMSTQNFDLKNDSLICTKNIFVAYNKKGLPATIISKNADGSIDKTETFTYYKNKEVAQHEEYDQAGLLIRSTVTDFDAFGNRAEENIYNNNNNLIQKTTYSYDHFGQKTGEFQTDGNGNTLRRVVYIYDKKGSITSRNSYDENGRIIAQRIFNYEY